MPSNESELTHNRIAIAKRSYAPCVNRYQSEIEMVVAENFIRRSLDYHIAGDGCSWPNERVYDS